MLIRPFMPADAPALAILFHASVHHGANWVYSREQLAAWSPTPPNPENYIQRAADRRVFLVAVDELGEPLAYGDLAANGHVDHLYCRPDRIGTGVASALYDDLERAALEQGLAALSADASEAARPLFERKGFKVDVRQEITVSAIAIHNYRMTKRLASLLL
ncbi:MAG: GNAT family N-acetyltransferase [Sphingomonas sp.]|jgi:putative acetyltransferase